MENEFQHLTAVEVKEYNDTKSVIDSKYDRMEELKSEVHELLLEELRSKGLTVSDKSYGDAEEKEDAFIVGVNIREAFMRGKEYNGEIHATIYNRKYYWSHSGIISCSVVLGEGGDSQFDFNHGSGGTNAENRLETIKVAADAFKAIQLIGEHMTSNQEIYRNIVKEFILTLKEANIEGRKLSELRTLNEKRENDSAKEKFTHIFDQPTSEGIAEFIDQYNTQSGVVIGHYDDYRKNFVMKKLRIDKFSDESGRTRFQTCGLKKNNAYSRTSRKELEEALTEMLIIDGKALEDISELLGNDHHGHTGARVSYDDMTQIARSIDAKKLIGKFEKAAEQTPQKRRKM